MAYVADLHIHSRYSGACSYELTIPNLSKWAVWKGIDLLGTGDALHPMWQQELKANLQDIGGGIYQNGETKFVVSGEISCIYSESGKTRRIHLILIYPSLDTAMKLGEVLKKRGAKLASDGRPILGITSKMLCELAFQVDSNILIIPAHIWTPWYSLYGSNSGYDLLTDCFGEFSEKIYAVETGLSSEPAMNWRIPELDNKSIVSFSDLHSLPRLGREVTLINGKISFANLSKAFQTNDIIGSIEFFPEEGKYHYSGHRNCGVVMDSNQLKQNGEICPVCKKKMTIGVMQRVEELALRSEKDLEIYKENGVFKSKKFPDRPGFRMLIQLEEILAESLGVAVKTAKVKTAYEKLITELDSELKILTKVQIPLIEMAAGEKVAEGVRRVREGQVKIEPGYDNTYGIVKIFDEKEVSNIVEDQGGLF
jgi:uncharacterized protein (TIGR00375 family)